VQYAGPYAAPGDLRVGGVGGRPQPPPAQYGFEPEGGEEPLLDEADPAGEAVVGAAWVQERMGALEKQMRALAARAESAELTNRDLVYETQSLRAKLDAQMRLADEKLNQEIRERAELQLSVRVAEREQTYEKSTVQALSSQLVSLQLELAECRQQQQQLASAVELAATADAAAARLKLELEAEREEAALERNRLAERGGRLEDLVGRVRSELLANAEQVGHELRLRMQAIQNIDEREALDARAAVDASRELAERLADLSEELKGAEGELQHEKEERLQSDQAAAQARDELQSALEAQQQAAAQQAQQEIDKLRHELGVREHAERALKAMLAAAHAQQGALEDKGDNTQAQNQLTFDDLRAMIAAVDVRVSEEVGQRKAAIEDVKKLVAEEAEARGAAVQKARDAATAATAATEQVLRTEIRARMKGEVALSNKLLEQSEAAATATHRVQQALDEEVASSARQIKALGEHIAEHTGRSEAELATHKERLEAITGRQASAISALHKEHNDLVKATRSAVAALKKALDDEIAALEARRIEAVAQVQQKLEAADAANLEATTQRVEQTEALALSKLEDAHEALARERLERTNSDEALIASFEARYVAQAAMTAAVEKAIDERLVVHDTRLDATDKALQQTTDALQAEVDARAQADEKMQSELQVQIDNLVEELSTTNGQLEAQAEVQMTERAERVEAVRHANELAAAQLAEVAAELSATASAVRDEIARSAEAAAAALSHVQYKTQRNLQALQEGLQQGLQDADAQLQQLEQHCAHQLQHGLDALGANLEHLLENGIALESMARTDADHRHAADVARQFDALETTVHVHREEAAAAAEAAVRAAEVRACVADLVAMVEADEARASRDGMASALEVEVRRASAFEASLSARLTQLDFKHEERGDATNARLQALEKVESEGIGQVRSDLEQTRHELVLTTARQTKRLDEERSARIQAVEEAEILAREIEAAQQQAEVHSVMEDMLLRLEQRLGAESERRAHNALVDTVETLHVATSKRIKDVQAEAGAEAATLRLVTATAEAALGKRIDMEVHEAREEAAAFCDALRQEGEERRVAGEKALRAELAHSVAKLDAQIEDTVSATLRAAEEKEVVEETVQRLIEALEEREQYEAERARQKQLVALEKEMNERRAAAAAEAEAERAAQSSRATEIENQVVRLSTRLEKVEAEATAKYEQAAEFVTTAGETIEKKCAAQMEAMQATVDGSKVEADQKLALSAERMKELEAAAKQAEASVEALKLGLGLAGLGGEGEGSRTVRSSELEGLREQLKVDVAKVSAQLEAAIAKFELQSEGLRIVAEEARALKLERVEKEKEDAEKAAAREKELRLEAATKAAKSAEDAAESLAQKEVAEQKAKKADEERLRAQAAAKQAQQAEAKAKAEAAAAKDGQAQGQGSAPAPPSMEGPGSEPQPEPAADGT
jgi:hypothetical protein